MPYIVSLHENLCKSLAAVAEIIFISDPESRRNLRFSLSRRVGSVGSQDVFGLSSLSAAVMLFANLMDLRCGDLRHDSLDVDRRGCLVFG